jgi:hypothetical protein
MMNSAITQAKIGRSIKKRAIGSSCSYWRCAYLDARPACGEAARRRRLRLRRPRRPPGTGFHRGTRRQHLQLLEAVDHDALAFLQAAVTTQFEPCCDAILTVRGVGLLSAPTTITRVAVLGRRG